MRLTFRQRVGLSLPSLVLRGLLAVVFIWAGLGKVTQRVEVEGQTAARLANMGVMRPVTAAADEPDATAPAPKREAERDAAEEDGAAPARDGGASDAAPARDGGGVVDRDEAGRPAGTRVGMGLVAVAWQDGTGADAEADASAPAVVYTAADFPEPVRVRRMWEVALLIQDAAHPPATGEGKPMGIWPEQLGDGPWPRYQAIAVTAAELGAGVLLVMGLLTRVSALALMCVTAGAMWLTEIGPAIQGGDAVLGFLPNYATFDAEAWRPLVLWFALFMSSLALLLAGPGRPSVDHALFGRRTIEDDDGL